MDRPDHFAVAPQCAIYTRKSVACRFAQEVTSLDAQRAICSAYISSQQHKGWEESLKHYDDLGQSGATLERPALQDLISDIEVGLVNVVLVYKVDRISRTLLDFVRLMDIFDRFGVSFVSITQNFDTSDTMGRLVRNILLTFAQFEREISNDRVRDKKRVMRQRGLWTGGFAPTGYTLRNGKLVIDQEEAKLVRFAFETYAETQSLTAVHRGALQLGLIRRPRKFQTGGYDKGGPASYSVLDHILTNPVYVGDLRSFGDPCKGIHLPIIDRPLWDRVQELREKHRLPPRKHPPHLLTGLIFDLYGRRMHGHHPTTPLQSRYYSSCETAHAKTPKLPSLRARADHLEGLVLETLKQLLRDRAQLSCLLMGLAISGRELGQLCEAGLLSAQRLAGLGEAQLLSTLRLVVHSVNAHPDRVRIVVRLEGLIGLLGWNGRDSLEQKLPGAGDRSRLHVIEISARIDRRWHKHYLPVSARKNVGPRTNQSLLALMKRAREAHDLMLQHRELEIPELARIMNSKPATFSRLIRLNYLAPDIVTSIVDGTQPERVTSKFLMTADMPSDWALQRTLLGYKATQPEH